MPDVFVIFAFVTASMVGITKLVMQKPSIKKERVWNSNCEFNEKKEAEKGIAQELECVQQAETKAETKAYKIHRATQIEANLFILYLKS